MLLKVAEKHGLFSAYDGEELNLDLVRNKSDQRSLWKSYARVESIKRSDYFRDCKYLHADNLRLIVCLLITDATYARLLGTAGVVQADKLEIMLPDNAALFEAKTPSSFSQATKIHSQISIPRQKLLLTATHPPRLLNNMGFQAMLAAISIQVSAARHKLLVGTHDSLEQHSFVPAKVYAKDPSAKLIAASLISISKTYKEELLGKNQLVLWNSLCISITADLHQLDLASGCRGVEYMEIGLRNIKAWSKSAAGRRAALHAANIFWTLSGTRASQPLMLAHEDILFTSALVLSFYVLTAPEVDVSQTSQDSAFEVLQDIDWADIDDEGLSNKQDGCDLTASYTQSRLETSSCCASRKFVRDGGPISFGGNIQSCGSTAARKLLLNYAHLVDELGRWEESEYSHVLRIIGDLFD
jgi:hypothetical protein